jgi:NADH-quinone oxidoreductase subunit M
MLTGLLIGWPFLSALFVYLFKGDDAKKVAFGASLLQLVFTIYILTQFQYTDKLQLEMQLPWIASMGINFHVAIDGISVILVLLTNLLVPFIILSSFSSKYENPRAFYALILIMQTALIGVFTSLDGFLFYVFWELALLPIYFICLLWGGENRGKITFKFFVYTLFGSLFMLVALIYLYLQTPDAHSFD